MENYSLDIKNGEIKEDNKILNDDKKYNSHHHHHHHSEHSHHHRHHRHHNHRSRYNKQNKFIAFLKRHRSAFVNIISCAVSIVLLVIMALNVDFSNNSEIDNSYTDITQSTIRVETSVYPEKVLIVNKAISYYMNSDNVANANEVYKSFEGHKNLLNVGEPLNFTYRVTGLPSGVKVESVVLEVSENENYSDALTYKLDLDNSTIDIYNLKTGINYYYRVNLTLNNASVVGTTGTFETEKSPRILNIDGAANARDIGGWNTVDGMTIKQGLLYRGSEIDGAVQPEYKITDRGLQQMIGELGIRFDMDLRSEFENKNGFDALGKNVIHKYYGVGMYSALLDNEEQLREIFSDLANPDNYPIYLHCTYGRDRTGSICYLLEALLGVSDSDLQKEYEISAFTDSYVNTAEFNAFVEKINTFKGDTTQKKVEGYLLSIGVSAEEIATIREILLKMQ